MLIELMKRLFHIFAERFVDWLFRPRTLAVGLLKYGCMLAALAFAADFLVQINYRKSTEHLSFSFGTGQGLPQWASLGVLALGAICVVMALLMAASRSLADIKNEKRRLLIVIELRGLADGPDTPADEIFKDFNGRTQLIRVDFRPAVEGDPVSAELAVSKVCDIKSTVALIAAGRDSRDVSLALGGLAAVPVLFLAGFLVDDENSLTLFDWNRQLLTWQRLNGPDDGERLESLINASMATQSIEAVLAVSISYQIDLAALAVSFNRDIPIYQLNASTVKIDRTLSEVKHQACASAFSNAVQSLMSRGVTRIHLVLAAPASLSILIGSVYDRRLMPELIVYQYERSANPPYPWGIQMPTHGQVSPLVVQNGSA